MTRGLVPLLVSILFPLAHAREASAVSGAVPSARGQGSAPCSVCAPTSAVWGAGSTIADADFGESVANAGDVNGDGFDDVIVGAWRHTKGEYNEGAAYLFAGSASGLGATALWSVETNQVSAHFGYSVDGAGDVNGDGFDDLIVGAYGYDVSGVNQNEGQAFVYHGSPTGPQAVADWTASEGTLGSSYARSVAGVGDVNGDGFDDVVVADPGFSHTRWRQGIAYLYLGSATGLSATPDWATWPSQTRANFGDCVRGAGDVNGDGFDDLVVGSPKYDLTTPAGVGAVHVFHGSSTGLNPVPSWFVVASLADTGFGSSVDGAGDVNGDGYGDVIVGEYRHSNGEPLEGRALVYLGSASGLASTPAWTSESNQFSSFYGFAVAGAGDLNDDGFGDVVVGAYDYDFDLTDQGRVFVHHGSAAGLAPTESWSESPLVGFSEYGYSVSGAGDVNGDGFGDLVVGAGEYMDGAIQGGYAFGYHGSACGIPASTRATVLSRNAGTNPASFIADPAVLGGWWTCRVHPNWTGHTHGQVLGFTQPLAGTVLPGGQTLLVGGTRLFQLPMKMAPSAVWSATIPNDTSICGLTVFLQGVHLLGAVPYRLTNAIDLTIGF